jgi:hypothetical protein
VTAVAFSVSVVTGILALGQHGTFTSPDSNGIQREDARASGRGLALVSDVALGATLASAGFTAYWYLFKYKPAKAALSEDPAGPPEVPVMSKVQVLPWVEPSVSGVSVAGSF